MSELNFAVWPAGSSVQLCNVPWDQNYRDVVAFRNVGELNSYLANGADVLTLSQLTYIRADQPVILEVPFERLLHYNYLRVFNPSQPTEVGGDENGRNYYYFINEVIHIAPNTTALSLTLDVYQTFSRDTSFGRCFVERGHVAMAQMGSRDDGGRRYLNAPEGLDMGQAYVTIDQRSSNMGYYTGTLNPACIVFATSDITGDSWNYTEPEINRIRRNKFIGIPSGVGMFYAPGGLSDISSLPAWVQQTIVAIVAVPDLSKYWRNVNSSDLDYLPDARIPATSETNSFDGTVLPEGRMVFRAYDYSTDEHWERKVETYLGERYKYLQKFYTAPYCVFEINHGADNSLTLLPQNFKTLQWVDFYHELSISLGSTHIKTKPLDYNSGETYSTFLRADYDTYVTTGALPSLGTANDNAAIALANSSRTRAFQSQNFAYSRDQALRANQLSMDATNRGLSANQQISDLQGDYATMQQAQGADWAMQDAWRKGLTNVGMGAVGGALAGPAGIAGGAVLGIANTALGAWDTSIQNERGALQVAQANAQSQKVLDVNKGLTRANADANKAFADSTANNDYEQRVAGQLASIQDTEMLPPSMGSAPQGNIEDLYRGYLDFHLRLKMPDKGTIARIGEYWLRYGYAIREYVRVPIRALAMTRFTYWKMSECNIIAGAMPETFKLTLKAIFERGVTVHADPESIGVDVENTPIFGDYYYG